LLNRHPIAFGPVAEVFTEATIQAAFGQSDLRRKETI